MDCRVPGCRRPLEGEKVKKGPNKELGGTRV